jgi:hypothetical protein
MACNIAVFGGPLSLARVQLSSGLQSGYFRRNLLIMKLCNIPLP